MVPVSSTPIWCGVLVSDAELAPRLNAHGSSRERDIPRLALRGIRNYCGFGHPWGASKNEVLHINDFDTPTTRCPVVDRPSPPQPNQPQLDLIDQETDCGEPAGNTAARILCDEVCNRSDEGKPPLEPSERTERILASRDWLSPMKSAS